MKSFYVKFITADGLNLEEEIEAETLYAATEGIRSKGASIIDAYELSEDGEEEDVVIKHPMKMAERFLYSLFGGVAGMILGLICLVPFLFGKLFSGDTIGPEDFDFADFLATFGLPLAISIVFTIWGFIDGHGMSAMAERMFEKLFSRFIP